MERRRFQRIYVEILNQCNLRCSFCPPTGRKPRIMSPEEFDRVLGEAHPYANYVYLHVRGEPLMHPQLNEILDLCEKWAFQANITTNGTLLPQRQALLLQAGALRQVNVSLHSFGGREQAERAYLDGVMEFAKAAVSAGKAVALRLWNMAGDDGLDRERDKNRVLLDAIDAAFGTGPVEDILHGSRGIKIGEKLYLNHGVQFQWPSMDLPEVGDRGFCMGGRRQLAVLADGTVVPCCLDAEGKIPLGNLFEQPFGDILASRRLRTMTEGFDRRRVEEPLCRRCSYRMRFGCRMRRE